MSYLFIFFLFSLGLAVGSFLNVVILRYNPERSVFDLKNLSGRSHCPHCRKKLGFFELIPVLSFVFQAGRCLSCRKTISWQYPIVEFLTGAIFVLVPLFLNGFYSESNVIFTSLNSPEWYYLLVAAWVLVFLTWLVMTFVDFKYYIIPNELNLTIAILGLAISALIFFHQDKLPVFSDSFIRHYALLFSPIDNFVANRLVGVMVGGIFFGLLNVLGRGKAMGMGDVKLALASGLVFGWPDLGLVILLSFVIGGLWGAGLILLGRRGMKDRVPFAPFFIIASALSIFGGYQIVGHYFRLFGVF